MTRSEQFLCALYAIIAVVALITVWMNILAFMQQPENWNIASWYNALYASYAAAAIINDLFLLAIAGCIFMVVEAKRLHIRFVWVYILLSFAIAISVMFPLFLIARQMAFARQRMHQS